MPTPKQSKPTPAANRNKLHRLVDEIPEDETMIAQLVLEFLKGGRADV
jgi:hypothetical protein